MRALAKAWGERVIVPRCPACVSGKSCNALRLSMSTSCPAAGRCARGDGSRIASHGMRKCAPAAGCTLLGLSFCVLLRIS